MTKHGVDMLSWSHKHIYYGLQYYSTASLTQMDIEFDSVSLKRIFTGTSKCHYGPDYGSHSSCIDLIINVHC